MIGFFKAKACDSNVAGFFCYRECQPEPVEGGIGSDV